MYKFKTFDVHCIDEQGYDCTVQVDAINEESAYEALNAQYPDLAILYVELASEVNWA